MPGPHIIELDEAVSRIRQACEGYAKDNSSPFFFMVGAGISFPSVPLATEIVTHCKTVAEKYDRRDEPSSKGSIDVYSHWFQMAYAEPDQRQKYLRELIEGKAITHANFRLAHLLLNNTISNIVVTTNFDDFLSQALTLFGQHHIVCDHPQTVGRINPARSILQIVHLHGSYWFYDCCNLSGELKDRAQQSQQTTSTMASLLDMILWDRSPLVIGYSGWEGDVFMEALKRRLARPLGTHVYWFCYQRSDVEAIPDQFKANANIYFVVPTTKAIVSPDVSDTVIEQPAKPAQEAEQVQAKDWNTKMEGEPTLPADTVLVRLIRVFDLEAPALTKDPIGFFAKHLNDSLPQGDASDTDTDIYAIKNVIERVKRAKQRELNETSALVEPSELTLEQVRDALRRADYREAVRQGGEIEFDRLSPEDLDELSDALWSAAIGLNDNSEEEISAYNLVVTIGEKLSELLIAESPVMRQRVAKALVNKGVTLGALNRSEEAIAVYEDIVNRYEAATEPELRERVAKALYNKGVTLGALNRSEEAIAVYEDIVNRYGAATEPELRQRVAKALYNKGVTLGALNRSEEAIAVYEDIVNRNGAATEPELRELVAKALVNKGFRLGKLKRSEEAIAVHEDVVNRYGAATEPALREQVAKVLYNKGVTLGELKRSEEAIAVYEDIVKRYGAATEPALREQVAKALYNKGVTLGELKRNEEAIAVYEDIVKRYGAATEPALREQVAKALVNKGFRLGELKRSEEG